MTPQASMMEDSSLKSTWMYWRTAHHASTCLTFFTWRKASEPSKLFFGVHSSVPGAPPQAACQVASHARCRAKLHFQTAGCWHDVRGHANRHAQAPCQVPCKEPC